jgi:phosphatidylglycerol---prolipoprotein diacylglyceryl transferase
MPPTLAEAWLHDLSPFALRFSEGFGLRWYGLAYMLGFVTGYLQLRWLASRGLIAIPPHRCLDAVLAVVVGVVVGGRLGYVFFYEPALLWSFPAGVPWWGVLAIQGGGMSSHGGMVGVVLAAWRISRGWRTPDGGVEGRSSMLHIGDAMALVAPAGLFFGRLANFINGELLGRVAARPGEPAPWWSVKFPQEALTTHESFRTPAQDAALHALVAREARPEQETWDQVYQSILQRIQAGGEEGARLAAELAPLLSARWPSQLVQALAEGVVLGLALWAVWARPRRSGVVGCWFLILYGLLRIATEFVRLPDAGLSVDRVLGLSRGQWLSVAMVLIGGMVLARICRGGGAAVGGWMGSGSARAGD